MSKIKLPNEWCHVACYVAYRHRDELSTIQLFVRGSPHKGPEMRSYYVLYDARTVVEQTVDLLLFETPWHSFDVTAMDVNIWIEYICIVEYNIPVTLPYNSRKHWNDILAKCQAVDIAVGIISFQDTRRVSCPFSYR